MFDCVVGFEISTYNVGANRVMTVCDDGADIGEYGLDRAAGNAEKFKN